MSVVYISRDPNDKTNPQYTANNIQDIGARFREPHLGTQEFQSRQVGRYLEHLVGNYRILTENAVEVEGDRY